MAQEDANAEENVDLEEADELNSDKGSASVGLPAAGQGFQLSSGRMAEGSKFNQMMSQVIGQFADEDDDQQQQDHYDNTH